MFRSDLDLYTLPQYCLYFVVAIAIAPPTTAIAVVTAVYIFYISVNSLETYLFME